MIFKKLPSNDQSKINLDSYFDDLNYGKRIYRDRVPEILQVISNYDKAFADANAAYAADLFSIGLLPARFTEKYLSVASAMVQSFGFRFHSMAGLAEELNINVNQNKEAIILILGGQVPRNVIRRVQTGYQIIKKLTYPRLNVIFSGRNNAESNKILKYDPTIKYEATFMNAAYEGLVQKDNVDFGDRVKVFREEQSANTIENLNFVVDKYLSQIEAPVDLYVVSSTFHLPRVSQLINCVFSNNPALSQKIILTYLLGAENEDHEFLPHEKDDVQYIHSMVNEIHSILWNYEFINRKSFRSLLESRFDQNRINVKPEVN